MVAAGEAFDPSPANIESRVVRSTLPDGMKMSLLSRKTRGGTVVASVTIRYGDEKSLFGKSATAGITGGLLMRGTKNKSRQQIQDEMDRLKAQIHVSGGATSASASVETMEANLPGALRLAAEILREPSFPESEFETVRQQRIAAAEASRSDPQALAFTEFRHRMNPYPRGDLRYVSTADERSKTSRRSRLTMSANSTSSSMAPASVKSLFPDSSTLPRFPSSPPNFSAIGKAPAAIRASPTVPENRSRR